MYELKLYGSASRSVIEIKPPLDQYDQDHVRLSTGLDFRADTDASICGFAPPLTADEHRAAARQVLRALEQRHSLHGELRHIYDL